MSNCTKAGDAWIQRLACITFEKIPSTPFEPGGTAAGPLGQEVVHVHRPLGRPFDVVGAERVAEPAHREAGVEADPLDHPRAGNGVAERPQARASGRSAGGRAPSCAARTSRRRRSSSGRRGSPMPSRPSCVSAPPATTGVPAGMPVSAAAAAVTSPITVPDSSTGGTCDASSPTISRIVSDHVRSGQVEHARARAERDVGGELAGEAGREPVAEHPDVADRRRTPRGGSGRSSAAAPER